MTIGGIKLVRTPNCEAPFLQLWTDRYKI